MLPIVNQEMKNCFGNSSACETLRLIILVSRSKRLILVLDRCSPIFPGYLFVRVDLDLIGRSAVEWVPGGVGLVSFGDEPAFVSGSLINAIKQRIENLERASEENVIPLFKTTISLLMLVPL